VTLFRPTAAQLRAFESDGRVLLTGMRSGRRYAAELAIIAQAANPEEAKLCIEDLHHRGVALQSGDGRRVEPKGSGARFQYVRFDEEEK
jgi:hypothetical protein